MNKTMTQEDKNILLKDLCARLPYHLICHSEETGVDGELHFVNTIYDIVSIISENVADKHETCHIVNCKSYLRPMSSMTKEEDEEWRCYKSSIAESSDELLDKKINELHDWFYRKHIDFCGLIPMGLALEAKEGMYES